MIRMRLFLTSVFPPLIAILFIVPSAVAQQWYWEGTWDVYDPAGQICIDSSRGVLVKTSAPEGGGDLHRSSDQGTSWSYIGHKYLGGLATAPNGVVFAAHFGGGVDRSTDNGVTWNDAGFPVKTYGPIAATQRGHIFVAEELSKLWRSTDDGTSWTVVPNEFDGWIKHIAVGRTGDIFVAALGIYRSTDDGESWVHLDLRNTTGDYPVVSRIVVDSRGHLFAIVNGDSIAGSTDNGDSWTQLGSVRACYEL
jgi:photosystem II stability/assembly factor-like uncharacterized protein